VNIIKSSEWTRTLWALELKEVELVHNLRSHVNWHNTIKYGIETQNRILGKAFKQWKSAVGFVTSGVEARKQIYSIEFSEHMS
jgi:hypothetical protein